METKEHIANTVCSFAVSLVNQYSHMTPLKQTKSLRTIWNNTAHAG